MTNLLVFREQLKKFYSKHELYITPVFKFLLALLSLVAVNTSIGYMGELKKLVVLVTLSLVCSVLPMNFIVLTAASVALGHLYKFSIECAGVALVVFLLFFILYLRFSPGDTVAVLLTPLCFLLKIPYIMPIAVGLVGTPVSAVSVAGGAIVYYIIAYMTGNAASLGTFEAEASLERFRFIIDGILGNKTMFVTAAAFAATVIVVYFIRRLRVDHAWTIAIITGALLDVLILLFGDLMYDTKLSIVGMIVGSVVSVLLAKALEFFVFNVDYSRTEFVQFEDDEYYYYVKAVPKNTVAVPQKRVKTIRVPEKALGQQKRDI